MQALGRRQDQCSPRSLRQLGLTQPGLVQRRLRPEISPVPAAASQGRTTGSSRAAGRPARQRKSQSCICSSAGAAAAPLPEAQQTQLSWPGAKPVPLALSVLAGLFVRFLLPIPEGLTAQSWTLLSIFVSTIAGLVLEPLPTGAWAFLAATFAVFSKTLPFTAVFSAFCNDVIWLIVVSFFFAAGFQKTGLGERIATLFVRACGKSSLGLAYGLSIAEMLLAPAMPSTTARAGGIFMPIINSLSLSAGSEPGKPSSKRLGSFLVQSQFQGSVNSSAMFLTGAAQNLLCLKLATELGVVIASPWLTWFKAAVVPALTGLLVTPLLLYQICKPELTDTPEAPKQAEERLQKMGPTSRDEKIMMGVMLAAIVMWVLGEQLAITPVTAAMLGLSALLLTGVLKWKECLQYNQAWDTLFWFAILVGMSGQLNSLGVVKFFSDAVGSKLAAFNLGWYKVFGVLNVAYFGLHYMFASQTAHVSALYAAFVAMMLASGVPAVLAALSLGYVSNLFGSITHYGSGQGAVYYGANYVSLQEIFKVGALVAVVNIFIWGTIGTAWWKFIGLI